MGDIVLSPWVAVPAAILLICGGLLTLVGSLGLLRLKSFYARMHAPTMGATLGTGCVLVASMLVSSAVADRLRSEERRVGEEGSQRGSPKPLKNQSPHRARRGVLRDHHAHRLDWPLRLVPARDIAPCRCE